MDKLRELSLFLPVYNEEANLEKTVKDVIPVLRQIAKKYELIIVNDGSKDRSGEIAQNLARDNPFIRVITHPSNQGYGAALKSGFYNSQHEWIAFIDADGQFDFTEVTKLIEKAKEFDVIVGYRLNRQDSFKRKLFGWGWTTLSKILLGISVRDVDCAFKLIKRKVIKTIPPLQSTRGGMISPELLARAGKAGFKITEVGVGHFPRGGGKQTGAGPRVIFKSFFELGKLWWQIK